MKRNWKVIAPLALSAAGALAAGLVVLLGKNDKDAPAAAASAKKAATASSPASRMPPPWR